MPHDASLRSKTFPYAVRWAPTSRGPVAYFDEGEGPALLFVHGLVGDFTHFEHVAPRFAGRFRVLGIDLHGCGLSVGTHRSLEPVLRNADAVRGHPELDEAIANVPGGCDEVRDLIADFAHVFDAAARLMVPDGAAERG